MERAATVGRAAASAGRASQQATAASGGRGALTLPSHVIEGYALGHLKRATEGPGGKGRATWHCHSIELMHSATAGMQEA